MNKKNLILAVILVVLFIAAYIYHVPFKKWQNNINNQKNILSEIEIEQINKIEILQEEKVTILEKKNEKWIIGGTNYFYAQETLVKNLLGQIEEARTANLEIVSENKDKKKEFNTDVTGVNVKLLNNDQLLANFIVGKMASDYSSTYISRLDSDKTFLLHANLYSVFAQEDWHDKTIFSSEKDKISKVRFQYPTREFTIEKIDDKWVGILPYKFVVSEEKIDGILDVLSSLISVKIPEQKFEGTGLENHSIIVEATGENIDNILMIGSNYGDDLYYAKRGDSDNIYLITEETKEMLDQQIYQLK